MSVLLLLLLFWVLKINYIKCSNYNSSQKNNWKKLLNNAIDVKKIMNKYCLHLCLTMFIEFDFIINQKSHNLSRLRCAHKTKQTPEYSDWSGLQYHYLYHVKYLATNNMHAQRRFYPPRGKWGCILSEPMTST
jgi:hypothetical protein